MRLLREFLGRDSTPHPEEILKVKISLLLVFIRKSLALNHKTLISIRPRLQHTYTGIVVQGCYAPFRPYDTRFDSNRGQCFQSGKKNV